MVKTSITSGHLDILQTAIKKAVDTQMYPHWHLVTTDGTNIGPAYLSSDEPPFEAATGQEHYYVRSAVHLLICCSPSNGSS